MSSRRPILLSYARPGQPAEPGRPGTRAGPIRSGLGYAIVAAVFFPPIGISALILAVKCRRALRRGDTAHARYLGDRAIARSVTALSAFLLAGLAAGIASALLL